MCVGLPSAAPVMSIGLRWPGVPQGGKCGITTIVTVERDGTGFAAQIYLTPENHGCRLGHFGWKTPRISLILEKVNLRRKRLRDSPAPPQQEAFSGNGRGDELFTPLGLRKRLGRHCNQRRYCSRQRVLIRTRPPRA